MQVSSVSTEQLVLPRRDCCVLSRLRCNGHSLLLSSYLSRIDRIKNPSCFAADTRLRRPLISFCTVQLRTLCAARSLATHCLLLPPLVQALGSCPASGASWCSAIPHPSERGRVTTTTRMVLWHYLHTFSKPSKNE